MELCDCVVGERKVSGIVWWEEKGRWNCVIAWWEEKSKWNCVVGRER